MSNRRLAIVLLALLAVVVAVSVSWIRVELGPEGSVDTAATFGFLTLVVIQIAKLGNGSDGDG